MFSNLTKLPIFPWKACDSSPMASRIFDFPVLGSPMKRFSLLQLRVRCLIDLKFLMSSLSIISRSTHACMHVLIFLVFTLFVLVFISFSPLFYCMHVRKSDEFLVRVALCAEDENLLLEQGFTFVLVDHGEAMYLRRSADLPAKLSMHAWFLWMKEGRKKASI